MADAADLKSALRKEVRVRVPEGPPHGSKGVFEVGTPDGGSTDQAVHCLVVSAHPLAESLCHRLTATILAELDTYEWSADHLDLYKEGFAPTLTADERRSYYEPHFDTSAVEAEISRLCRAEVLILVFPTWWFCFPAILKGWFDRVWAPGFAFANAEDGGLIKPELSRLRWVLAVTTLGSPRWVDLLVLRRPVRRILKSALIGACAPQAGFTFRTLYRAENLDLGAVTRFEDSVRSNMRAIAGRLSKRIA